jgi:miniconductance mechanosensitive channel
VQLVKFFVIVIAVLIVVAVVFNTDLRAVVTGLGAMAAVLILVFKDTLLGLVASIQLSVNQMVKIGDWISIPGRNVDGNVTDITLNTVKIQNFDKTIITVPTYSLVNESFQNWKGMEESGVRQIKRSLLIDFRSITFLSDELRETLSKDKSMHDLLIEFEKHGGDKGLQSESEKAPFFNTSRITNLSVFRVYAERYLRQHPLIDTDQALVVRHREPDPKGLPLQIYAFTKKNQFALYENVQAEIFEHLVAIMNEFGLTVYQQPGGYDFPTQDRNSNQIP